MATLHELITKVIPLKGILRTPSYWMRKVLMAIADKVEAVQNNVDIRVDSAKTELQNNLDATKTELQNKDNDLETKKISMVYFPSSNSVLLQDGNGYVQLFGTRSGDNRLTVKVKDGVTSVYIFGQTYPVVNGEYTYELDLTKTSYADAFGGGSSKGQSNITYISPFISPNVTSMYNMFDGCSSLTSLDVSGFDTSAVTSMDYMFQNCSSLTSLDLSNFDTSAVTDMRDMFNGCSSLTSLDVSSFNTSAITNTWKMFDGCSSLTSLDVSGFDTSAVTSMDYMFQNCSSLTSLDLSNFDTSKVTSMGSTFDGCSSLTSLDVSGFDISKVTYRADMFKNCPALKNIKCKQAFKDFASASSTKLNVANITWEIVE